MMNLEENSAKVVVHREDESIADRWIKARLNRTVGEVIRGLDEYRFNDAAAAVYQFVWHELCDWYLELVKPVLYGKEDTVARRAAQKTLVDVLTASLKLLHPFMPFLTEEIWQTLVADGSSIMVSAFPETDEALSDPEAEKEMTLIMEVITRIRNIRGEMNITPSLKLKATLAAPADDLRATLETGRGYIMNLANLETLDITGEMREPKGAATAVAGPIHVYVFLTGVIDVAGEENRLQKEIARIDKDLAVVSRKLANPEFLAKAAVSVVKKEQDKARSLGEKRAALGAAVTRLAALSKDG
jgi:valyl-tRNA synthetase